MEKDMRYSAVKVLIETGHIILFKDIFNYLPKSKLAVDLGINNNRITRLMMNPDQFSLKELHNIASLIGIEPMVIINLVFAQLHQEQNKHKPVKNKGNKKTSI